MSGKLLDRGQVATLAALGLQRQAAVGQPGLGLLLQPALGEEPEGERVRAHPGPSARGPRPAGPDRAAHRARDLAAQLAGQAVVAPSGGDRRVVGERGRAHLEQEAVVVGERPDEAGLEAQPVLRRAAGDQGVQPPRPGVELGVEAKTALSSTSARAASRVRRGGSGQRQEVADQAGLGRRQAAARAPSRRAAPADGRSRRASGRPPAGCRRSTRGPRAPRRPRPPAGRPAARPAGRPAARPAPPPERGPAPGRSCRRARTRVSAARPAPAPAPWRRSARRKSAMSPSTMARSPRPPADAARQARLATSASTLGSRPPPNTSSPICRNSSARPEPFGATRKALPS